MSQGIVITVAVALILKVLIAMAWLLLVFFKACRRDRRRMTATNAAVPSTARSFVLSQPLASVTSPGHQPPPPLSPVRTVSPEGTSFRLKTPVEGNPRRNERSKRRINNSDDATAASVDETRAAEVPMAGSVVAPPPLPPQRASPPGTLPAASTRDGSRDKAHAPTPQQADEDVVRTVFSVSDSEEDT